MTETVPRTSIIMPVYNTASQVVRAIRSVLAQCDNDFELLILNDQSPDEADTVIRNFLAKTNDSRIRYEVNPTNLGLAATRNRGIDLTSGRWIAFLDSDDAFKPDFLATMQESAESDIDVVVCAHDITYEDGSTRKRERRSQAGVLTGHEAMLALLRDEMTPYAWDKIFRRTAVQNLRFPLVNRTEDAGYLVGVYQQARRVKIIDASLTLYSVNPQSITWGSVPPVTEMYKFVDYLKKVTGAHRGTEAERNALATYWSLTFLNGAQSALRLNPSDLNSYLKQCQNALNFHIIFRTLRTRPIFGAAAMLLKISPYLYKKLYGAYVKRTYNL